ncbi:MAG: DUF721 domain-containing protein [Desulfomonilaceae bacterium]|nr:DUF721 domain-containing protein [Desulfomonilaceae bacterium]
MNGRTRKFPASISSVVKSALDRKGLTAAFARHAVIREWPRIVPRSVSAHAVALKVTGSVLHVEVDSSAWMHELAAIKHILLQKINAHLPPGAAKIQDVRFYQRSRKTSAPSAEPEPVPPAPTDGDLRTARQVLEPIRDEDLKTVLERILEKDRRLKWRRER